MLDGYISRCSSAVISLGGLCTSRANAFCPTRSVSIPSRLVSSFTYHDASLEHEYSSTLVILSHLFSFIRIYVWQLSITRLPATDAFPYSVSEHSAYFPSGDKEIFESSDRTVVIELRIYEDFALGKLLATAACHLKLYHILVNYRRIELRTHMLTVSDNNRASSGVYCLFNHVIGCNAQTRYCTKSQKKYFALSKDDEFRLCSRIAAKIKTLPNFLYTGA